MKAMILAAGRGERMRPLTDKLPKPLLEVRGKPLIVWHLKKLSESGFKDIVINIAHLGHKIPETIGDGSKYGLNVTYSDEQNEGALESAGGIVKALPLLGNEPFLVVNGDVFCDYSFNTDFDLGEKLAHLILVPNPKHNLNGDFALEGNVVLNDTAIVELEIINTGINPLTISSISSLSFAHPAIENIKLPIKKKFISFI